MGSSRQADLDWASLRGLDCYDHVLHSDLQHLEGAGFLCICNSSSELGAKDKRMTMLLLVLSPSWVEIQRIQAPMLECFVHVLALTAPRPCVSLGGHSIP